MLLWSAFSCMGASPGLPTCSKRKGSAYSAWEAFIKLWVYLGKIMSQTLMYYLVLVSSARTLSWDIADCVGWATFVEWKMVASWKTSCTGACSGQVPNWQSPSALQRCSQKRPCRCQDQYWLLRAGGWQSGQMESHCVRTHHGLWGYMARAHSWNMPHALWMHSPARRHNRHQHLPVWLVQKTMPLLNRAS